MDPEIKVQTLFFLLNMWSQKVWSLAIGWVRKLSDLQVHPKNKNNGERNLRITWNWKKEHHLPNLHFFKFHVNLQGWLFVWSWIYRWTLTWNLKMGGWKMMFLFNWVMFKFHVNLQGFFWSDKKMEQFQNCFFTPKIAKHWIGVGETASHTMKSLVNWSISHKGARPPKNPKNGSGTSLFVNLEPKWPLFLKVNPPKTRPFPIKTRSLGFQECIAFWKRTCSSFQKCI